MFLSDVVYTAFNTKFTLNGKTDYIGPPIECYLRHAEHIEHYLCSHDFPTNHKVKVITLGQVLKIYLAYQAFKVLQEEVKEANFTMHHSNYCSIRSKSPTITRKLAYKVCYNDISHLTSLQINFIGQAFRYCAAIKIIQQIPFIPPKKDDQDHKSDTPLISK